MKAEGPYRLVTVNMNNENIKHLQELIGGYFEFHKLATKNGIEYVAVMNED